MWYFFFIAPFPLWLCTGWFTLHCLRNREYIYFFSLTYTLDLFTAALHVHKPTKAQLDFDPHLPFVIVNVCIHQITFYHWNNPIEISKGTWILKNPNWKILPGLNLGLQLPIMSDTYTIEWHWCRYEIRDW